MYLCSLIAWANWHIQCHAACPLHGSQPCHGEGTCITQQGYDPHHAGPLKMDQSYWRVLTYCGLPVKEVTTHTSILASRTPWSIGKGKKILHWKTSSPGWKVSNMLLAKSGGQLLIVTERMKWLGQSRKNTQLWICLVLKVKSDPVKNNMARKNIA